MTGVSVIICCYNSSLLLPETLKHIKQQNLAGIACEVVLVDNASTDNTTEVAKAIWDDFKDIELRTVYEATPGLSHARQKGANEAKYEYLIFCDDDNWLDENYVQNVFKFFTSFASVAVLGGVGTAQFENPQSKPAWFDNLHQGYAVSLQAGPECYVDSVYGAGMAIRKSVFEAVVNEFPFFLYDRKKKQLTAGGDSEICLRIRLAGYKIFYSPQLTFKHFLTDKRLTWHYLKKLYTGFAQMYVILNLYEKALNSIQIKLSPLYWIKKNLYYWGIYLKYWPKHFAAYSKAEGTVDEIHHMTWRVIAQSYLKYNFKTMKIYKQIVALKHSQLEGIFKEKSIEI
jgi:glycosyltransferase involved in cell wall biosynthesis